MISVQWNFGIIHVWKVIPLSGSLLSNKILFIKANNIIWIVEVLETMKKKLYDPWHVSGSEAYFKMLLVVTWFIQYGVSFGNGKIQFFFESSFSV